MDWGWLWKSVILITGGIILMRFAGRKSISQMTIVTTVIMIALGTSIASPVGDKNIWKALGSVSVFVAIMIFSEFMSLKFNWFENLVSGKAVTVVENGTLQKKNLMKVRMTVDQLEVRLRQKGVANIEDVKVATVESNGQLGYQLYRHAQPLTVGEFEKALGPLLELSKIQQSSQSSGSSRTDLFQEIQQNQTHAPKDLQ